jgi:hypothetical protein
MKKLLEKLRLKLLLRSKPFRLKLRRLKLQPLLPLRLLKRLLPRLLLMLKSPPQKPPEKLPKPKLLPQ